MKVSRSGALAAYFLDPDRGKGRRYKATSWIGGRFRGAGGRMERTARWAGAETYWMKQRLTHLQEEQKDYDDATLAQKVRSELFLDPEMPLNDGIVRVWLVEEITQHSADCPSPRGLASSRRRVSQPTGGQRTSP